MSSSPFVLSSPPANAAGGTGERAGPGGSGGGSYLSAVLKPMAAIKLGWPSASASSNANAVNDLLTPRASAQHTHELNPFDSVTIPTASSSTTAAVAAQAQAVAAAAAGTGPYGALIGNSSSSGQPGPGTGTGLGVGGATVAKRSVSNATHGLVSGLHSPLLTPLAPGNSPAAPSTNTAAFSAALPTTSLSLHPIDFDIKQPPAARKLDLHQQPPEPRSGRTSPSSSVKGQLHIKLISARGLNVRSARSRPYVVVLFGQSEFVSREPTSESEKEVKGTPVVLSRNTSSTALGALGAITKSRPFELAASLRPKQGAVPVTSANSTPPSSGLLTPGSATDFGAATTLGRSAANPIWKHEVSLCVGTTCPLLRARGMPGR